jgi:hypothetical protein
MIPMYGFSKRWKTRSRNTAADAVVKTTPMLVSQ